MGDSKNPNSSALSSSPTPCQSSSNLQMLHSKASPDIISKFAALEKPKKMISHVRGHYSQAYKVITPFCMTRFANYKLASIIQSYGGYHRWDLFSTQQNQPITNLNLSLINLQVSRAPFFELIPMAIISLFDFTLTELTQQQGILQPSFLSFSVGTTMIF